jgi:immune inhibitor A
MDGFSIVGATSTEEFDNFYIAGHRSYVSYDQYLKTGPYFFGYPATPDKVDHYSYQEGLLISYWDTSQVDNNTNVHPGTGRNLIIDAHPAPFYNLEGLPWRARIQVYDAPFSLKKADSFTLHINGKPSYIRGQAAQPLFDDTQKYFYDELPNHGVKLPAVGVKIKVVDVNGTSMKVRIS